MFRPHQGKERSLLAGRFCINEESPQDLVLVSAYSFSIRQCHERGGRGSRACVRLALPSVGRNSVQFPAWVAPSGNTAWLGTLKEMVLCSL